MVRTERKHQGEVSLPSSAEHETHHEEDHDEASASRTEGIPIVDAGPSGSKPDTEVSDDPPTEQSPRPWKGKEPEQSPAEVPDEDEQPLGRPIRIHPMVKSFCQAVAGKLANCGSMPKWSPRESMSLALWLALDVLWPAPHEDSSSNANSMAQALMDILLDQASVPPGLAPAFEKALVVKVRDYLKGGAYGGRLAPDGYERINAIVALAMEIQGQVPHELTEDTINASKPIPLPPGQSEPLDPTPQMQAAMEKELKKSVGSWGVSGSIGGRSREDKG